MRTYAASQWCPGLVRIPIWDSQASPFQIVERRGGGEDDLEYLTRSPSESELEQRPTALSLLIGPQTRGNHHPSHKLLLRHRLGAKKDFLT